MVVRNMATYIASTNTTGNDQAPSRATLSPDEVCLRSLNAFLDYFLAMILQDSKSVELKELQATLTHLLDSPLGHVALQEAMAELETYKSQAAGQGRHFDEEEERAAAARKAADQPFNVEAVWAQARVRCMVYSTIGEREEADFPPLPENEHSVSPPVAIFLTAILEFLGEHILFTTARFARERLGQDVRGLMTHADLDQGIRTDPVLATLWSDYWEIMPLSMQGKQPSPLSPSAAQFSNNVSPGQQYAERFLPSPAASSPAAPQYVPALLPPADLGVQQLARSGAADEIGTPVVMRKQSPAIEQQKRMQPSVEDAGDDKFARLQSNLGTALQFGSPQQQQQATFPASPARTAEPYAASPRKGVSIGVSQPRDVPRAGEPMTRSSSDTPSEAETSTTFHAPTTTSDFDAFLRYEQLREQENKARASSADAQRLRIVAAREAALAENARENATPVPTVAPSAPAPAQNEPESPVLPATQVSAPARVPASPKPATTPTAATTAASRPLDPYDAYLVAPIRSSPRGTSGFEPRDATGSPVGEQTLRLAAFLRNTAPPGQVNSPTSPVRPEQSRNGSRKSVPLLDNAPSTAGGATAVAPGAMSATTPASPSASKSEPKVQRVKAQRSSVRRPIESGNVSDASTSGGPSTTTARATAFQADSDAFKPDASRAETLADFLFNAPPPPAAVSSPRMAGAEILPPSNYSANVNGGNYGARSANAASATGSATVGAATVVSRYPLQKVSTSSTTFVDDESVTTPTSARKMNTNTTAAAGAAAAATAGGAALAGEKMYLRPEDDTSRSSIYRVAHSGKRDRLRVTSLQEQRADTKTEREIEDELLAADEDEDEGLDELLGVNRKKRNVESLADFLRNYTPPPASAGTSGSVGPGASSSDSATATAGAGPASGGKRMANLGKRLSSMNFVKSRSTSAATNADSNTDDASGAAAAVGPKPSRPTHRPLIPSASIPNGASD